MVYILANTSINVSNVQHSGRYRSDNGREQVLVIMLNLLIAVMTKIFEESDAQAVAQMYRCRAGLILEFEAGMTEQELEHSGLKEKLFPKFLHVMRPIKHSQLESMFHGKDRDEEAGLRKVLLYWSSQDVV